MSVSFPNWKGPPDKRSKVADICRCVVRLEAAGAAPEKVNGHQLCVAGGRWPAYGNPVNGVDVAGFMGG